VPCLKCDYCTHGHYPVCPHVKERLPGGFAEYILVPKSLVEKGTYRLPASMTYDQSTFIEPLACVVRAQNLAGIKKGRTILVLGCGMSGLLHIKLAKTKDCRIIATDINRARLGFAKRFGAEMTIDAAANVPERLTAEHGKKADVVILCTSAQSAIDQAWKCVDNGGSIVFFAVPGPEKQVTVPINDFWTKEVKILTSYYCGPPDIVEAIELLKTGTVAVDDLITHQLPLTEIAKGFQLVIEGQESMKIIIRPNES
jgi:L-iditol 2-dehydrogenase